MDVVSAVSAISALAGQSIQLVDAITTFVKQVKTAKTEINSLLQCCSAASVDLKQFSENLQVELKLKLCIDAFYAELGVTIRSCEETFKRLEVTLERAAPGILKHQPDQGTSFQRKFDSLTWPFKRKDLLAVQHSLTAIREDLSKKTELLIYTHMVNAEKVARVKAKQKDRKDKKTQKVLEEYYQSKRKTFLLHEKMHKIKHSNIVALSDEVTSGSDLQPFSDIMSDSDAQRPGNKPEERKSEAAAAGLAKDVTSNGVSGPQNAPKAALVQVVQPATSKRAHVDEELSDAEDEEGSRIHAPAPTVIANGDSEGPMDEDVKVSKASKPVSGNSESKEDIQLWQTLGADAAKDDQRSEPAKPDHVKLQPDPPPIPSGDHPTQPPPSAVDKTAPKEEAKQNEGRSRLPIRGKEFVDDQNGVKPDQSQQIQLQTSRSTKQKHNSKNNPDSDGPYLSFILRNDGIDWRCYPLPMSENDLKTAAGEFSRKGKSLWRYFDRIDHRQLEMIQTNLITTPINEDDRTWVIVALQIRPKRARGDDVRTIQVIMRWDWTQWKKGSQKNNLHVPSIPLGLQQPFPGSHASKAGMANQKRVEAFPPSDSVWVHKINDLPPPPPPPTSKKYPTGPPGLAQSVPLNIASTAEGAKETSKQPKELLTRPPAPAMASGALPPPKSRPAREPSLAERDQKAQHGIKSRKTTNSHPATEDEYSSERSEDWSDADEDEDSSTRPVQRVVERTPPVRSVPVMESSSRRKPWRSDQMIVKKSKRQPTEITIPRRTSPSDVYIDAGQQDANMTFMNMSQFSPPFMYNPNMMSFQAYQWMAFQQGLQQASYAQMPYVANHMGQPPSPPPRPMGMVQAPIDYPLGETYHEPGPKQYTKSSSDRRPPSANEMNSRLENDMNNRMMKEKIERLEKEKKEYALMAELEIEKKRNEKERKDLERERTIYRKERARSSREPTRSNASGLPKVPPKMAEEMRKYTSVDFETDVDLSEYSDGGPAVPQPPQRRKTRKSSESEERGDVSGNATDSDF